jgi:hypothetical protein
MCLLSNGTFIARRSIMLALAQGENMIRALSNWIYMDQQAKENARTIQYVY